MGFGKAETIAVHGLAGDFASTVRGTGGLALSHFGITIAIATRCGFTSTFDRARFCCDLRTKNVPGIRAAVFIHETNTFFAGQAHGTALRHYRIATRICLGGRKKHQRCKKQSHPKKEAFGYWKHGKRFPFFVFVPGGLV